jgi:hypothetical protein
MGVALDSPAPDEYVRAHVLAGQAEKQLRLEQGYTAQARRSSKLFDRSVAPFLDAAGQTVAGGETARLGGGRGLLGAPLDDARALALDADADGERPRVSALAETEPQRVLRLLGDAIAGGARLDKIQGTPEFEALQVSYRGWASPRTFAGLHAPAPARA